MSSTGQHSISSIWSWTLLVHGKSKTSWQHLCCLTIEIGFICTCEKATGILQVLSCLCQNKAFSVWWTEVWKKLCLVRAESLQIRAMWERKKMARAFIFRQNNNIGFSKKKKILLNVDDRTKTIYLHISNNHSKTQPLIFLPSANPLYYSLLSTDCFFSFDLFNLMV